MTYSIKNTDVEPYYDDYDENKNFIRMLFNPARAVQARELTQLQTILQNQITSFGNHIFQEGSTVIGGEIALKSNPYIIIPSIEFVVSPGTTPVPENDYDTLVGRSIRGLTSNALAKIVDIQIVGSDLLIHISITGGTFIVGEYFITENQPDEHYTTFYESMSLSNSGSGITNIGFSIKAVINTGIVYIAGTFVKVTEDDIKEIFVERESFTVDDEYKIGFLLNEDVITFGEDDTLRDVANGSNKGAIGADRYKVSITLKSYKTVGTGFETVPENFYEVIHLKILNSNGESEVIKYQDKVAYADIMDMLARRTNDESGSYVVKPYSLEAQEVDYNNNVFNYKISTGKSYVLGYEQDNISPKLITSHKGRLLENQAIRNVIDDKINVNFSSYVTVDLEDIGNIIGPFNGNSLLNVDLHNLSITGSTSKLTNFNVFHSLTINTITGIAISNAGTDYAVGDILSFTHSNSIELSSNVVDKSIFKVSSVTTGVITGISLISGGLFSATPGANTSTGTLVSDSGGGSGAVINLTVENKGNGLVTEEDWSLYDIKSTDILETEPHGNFTINSILPKVIYGSGGTYSNNTSYIINGYISRESLKIDQTDGTTIENSKIGTAKILYIDKNDNQKYKIFLSSDSDLRSLLQDTKTLLLNGSTADYIDNVVYYPEQSFSRNSSIVELPNSPIKDIPDIYFKSSSIFQKSAITPGVDIVFNISEANSFFDSANVGIIGIYETGTDIWIEDNISISYTTPTTATVASADHDLTGNYTFIIRINREAVSARGKTLTSQDVVILGGDIDVDGEYNLSTDGIYDLYSITSAINTDIVDPNIDNDVLPLLSFDDGQRDSFYDYGTIKGLNPGTNYQIKLWYFTHNTGDFFSVESYDTPANDSQDAVNDFGGMYPNIPIYTNQAKTKTFSLRSCLDFRKNITEISSTSNVVHPGSTITSSYDFYLPRKDIVWVDKDGIFGVTHGIPEENPKNPPENSEALTLFEVRVPGYVFGVQDMNLSIINNKNYTMMDVHKLERRIEGLEYYSSLLQLQLNSETLDVVGLNGLPRSKKGIFVDPFVNHIKGETRHPWYRVSMDYDSGYLRSPYDMNNIKLVLNDVGINGKENENTITLAYTPKEMFVQPQASGSINVNPYDVFVWAGDITMTPFSDFWVDTEWLPVLQVDMPELAESIRDLYEKIDAGLPRWNEWQSTLIGKVVLDTFNIPGHSRVPDATSTKFWDTTWGGRQWNINEDKMLKRIPGSLRGETHQIAFNTYQTSRTGTITEMTGTQTIEKDMGDRVVDVSQIPYMRKITIEFKANGLKPDTELLLFFDEVDVTLNGFYWHEGSSTFKAIDGIPGGGKMLKSDSTGFVKGKFRIPEQTFLTGESPFMLLDRIIDPTTTAAASFTSSGILQKKQKSILSVEVPTYTTRAIFEQGKNYSLTEEEFVKWSDPLAESFLIEEPGGVFLESIDLFFRSKDKNIPVTLQVVEMENGYPTQRIVPFSKTVVKSHDIIASYYNTTSEKVQYSGTHYAEDGTTVLHTIDGITGTTDFVPTKFSFSDPVYLKEGAEYAFIILSNSNNYEVWKSEMGKFDIISGNQITRQPFTGVMFKSQNASTWTPDQNCDIKFVINRCKFTPGSSTDVELKVETLVDLWLDNIPYTFDSEAELPIQVIYDDNKKIYELTADSAIAEIPSTSLNWLEIGKAEYDVTLFNATVDDIILPNTFIEYGYSLNSNDTIKPFVNKENNVLYDKKIINTLKSNNSNPIVQAGNMRTELDNITPVINKNRSSIILINNLVLPLAPANEYPFPEYSGDFNPTYDCGKYISRTTLLSEPSTDLRVLLDIYIPEVNSDVTVKFRTTNTDKRYLIMDNSSNYDTIYPELKDNILHVYQFDDDLTIEGGNINGWIEKSQIIVDGFGNIDTDSIIFVSSVGNYNDFPHSTVNTDSKTILTTEADIVASDITIYASGNLYDIDDYVFLGTQLYVSIIDNNNATPSPDSTVWELLESIYIDPSDNISSYLPDWQEMVTSTKLPEDFILTSDFVEYEFVPKVTPSETFDVFSIMVEMYSSKETTVPLVKRLRAVAVE